MGETFRDKLGENILVKVGEDPGEELGEKVGGCFGEIDKLSLCPHCTTTGTGEWQCEEVSRVWLVYHYPSFCTLNMLKFVPVKYICI